MRLTMQALLQTISRNKKPGRKPIVDLLGFSAATVWRKMCRAEVARYIEKSSPPSRPSQHRWVLTPRGQDELDRLNAGRRSEKL